MQVFHLENQLAPTALEAHLQPRRQVRALRASGLRAANASGSSWTPRRAEHRGPLGGSHVDFLKRAVHLGRDVLRAIGLGDATVVPEDLSTGRYGVVLPYERHRPVRYVSRFPSRFWRNS